MKNIGACSSDSVARFERPNGGTWADGARSESESEGCVGVVVEESRTAASYSSPGLMLFRASHSRMSVLLALTDASAVELSPCTSLTVYSWSGRNAFFRRSSAIRSAPRTVSSVTTSTSRSGCVAAGPHGSEIGTTHSCSDLPRAVH